MTDRPAVRRWVEDDERAWRSAGTVELAGLFTANATYLLSPSEVPVAGLAAIARKWDEPREGPGEVFTLSTEIVAVDGHTAVVRADVHDGGPVHPEHRDVRTLRLEADGRCPWFEESAYWPGPSYPAPSVLPGDA